MQPFWKTVWRFLKNLKIEQPYDTAIPISGIYISKIHRNTYLERFMYPNVENSAVLKSQVMEATQMPINRWMNRKAHTHTHTHTHTRTGILLSHKKEQKFTIYINVTGPRGYYA